MNPWPILLAVYRDLKRYETKLKLSTLHGNVGNQLHSPIEDGDFTLIVWFVKG